MKTFKKIRNILESHYPTQGSSIEYPKYKQMDMKNLVQDAIGDVAEDDGPHTSDIPDMPNFSTFAKPEDFINQSSSEGNRDMMTKTAIRKSGKPFKTLRKKMKYGGEDFSGAVASVGIGESLIPRYTKTSEPYKATASNSNGNKKAKKIIHDPTIHEVVKNKIDKGEYDYEGEMAKSSLRTIIRNAQMMHNMLKENTNLPEWVASKVTLAEDYIVSATQYMQSEMNEEVEQMDEVITKSTPTGEVISDFVRSKNPKFKGKSKKERIRMALGAKYAMMRKEEIGPINVARSFKLAGSIPSSNEEYISELSSLRKKIYVNKATVDKEKHLQKAREHENAADVFSFSNAVTTPNKQAAASSRFKALKRQRGITRALQSGIK